MTVGVVIDMLVLLSFSCPIRFCLPYISRYLELLVD